MEWISVKDRLPPDYHEVLYCATFQRGNKELMTGHREKGDWTHCCMFYSTMRLNGECEVTHWMELPDYPKPSIPTIAESAKIGNEQARAFAEKFVEKNKDLLKRLADR